MNFINGVPRYNNSKIFSQEDLNKARLNNQIILSGLNPTFIPSEHKEIYVFLEYLLSAAGSVVKDKDGNAVTGSVKDLNLTFSPLRIDGGIVITGTVELVKAFYISY